MKKLILLSSFLAISLFAYAQDPETTKKDSDPLDITRELNRIADYGVPTVDLVNRLKLKAETLYEEGLWQDAIDAYVEYAKKANWLANLLSQCLEPYYSASYKSQESISYARLKKYIPYESAANDLKEGRNHAYVRIGLCYKNLGNIENAVAYLYKGLDLIDIKSTEDWDLATEALSEIIGYTSN